MEKRCECCGKLIGEGANEWYYGSLSLLLCDECYKKMMEVRGEVLVSGVER